MNKKKILVRAKNANPVLLDRGCISRRMSRAVALLFLAVVVCAGGGKGSDKRENAPVATKEAGGVMRESRIIELPKPKLTGTVSVEEALAGRRSVREYSSEPLSLEELSQALWAAYGVNRRTPGFSFKTTPSAGACYPLEVYAVVGNVKGLPTGVFHYNGEDHALRLVSAGDVRAKLAAAALGQKFIEQAPATIFYAAVYERTTRRYGARGRERYVPMDLGHSAQNIYLQCEALGLGTVAVGAFDDARARSVVPMGKEEEPLYMMPIGRPKKTE